MTNQTLPINIAISDDEYLLSGIGVVLNIVEQLDISYSFVGSCAIQTYLTSFVRLPNDIDIMVEIDGISKIFDFCKRANIHVEETYGRLKVFLPKISVHIMPAIINVIDEIRDVVFGRIDLRLELSLAQKREIKLLTENPTILFNVLTLETNIFLELIRPPFTNSVMTICHLFGHCEIDEKQFLIICNSNPLFRDIIINRLYVYQKLILGVPYFDYNSLLTAQKKIKSIFDLIERF